jgi:hypothetical protein
MIDVVTDTAATTDPNDDRPGVRLSPTPHEAAPLADGTKHARTIWCDLRGGVAIY